MKHYIGTKTLMAIAMTLGDYNVHRGCIIPENEYPLKEGYLVEYPNGYQSWSPKEQFEEAYQSDGNYSFGHVDMKTADGTIVPWLCSQIDMQSNDWSIVKYA